jgi:hypothetical protein
MFISCNDEEFVERLHQQDIYTDVPKSQEMIGLTPVIVSGVDMLETGVKVAPILHAGVSPPEMQ